MGRRSTMMLRWLRHRGYLFLPLLLLMAACGIAIGIGFDRLGRHSVGILSGDHQIGPLHSGEFVGQTFETRFLLLTRAQLHLLRMENVRGTVEVSLRSVTTGETLARKLVAVASLPPEGAFVDILDDPVRTQRREPLEVRVEVPPDQPGGVGVSALSGNRFLLGHVTANGGGAESDALFIVESRGNWSETLAWLGQETTRVTVLGPHTMPYVVPAIVVFVGALIALALATVPDPSRDRRPEES